MFSCLPHRQVEHPCDDNSSLGSYGHADGGFLSIGLSNITVQLQGALTVYTAINSSNALQTLLSLIVNTLQGIFARHQPLSENI